MSLLQRIVLRHWATRAILTAALVFGGADLATRLAFNQGTVRAKVAEVALRSEPAFDHDTAASRISLVAAGARHALD